MKLSADILRRLSALNLPGEGLAGVLAILADMQADDDARRERDRERKRRGKSAEVPRKIQDVSAGTTAEPPPMVSPTPPSLNPPEVPKPTVSADSGPTQADLEKELFRRGRQVCGKNSGGLISSLLKAKQHDVALARAVIETAATKHDPREYVGGAIRNKANGQRTLKDDFAELRLELGDAAADAGTGDPPMRDITPRGSGLG